MCLGLSRIVFEIPGVCRAVESGIFFTARVLGAPLEDPSGSASRFLASEWYTMLLDSYTRPLAVLFARRLAVLIEDQLVTDSHTDKIWPKYSRGLLRSHVVIAPFYGPRPRCSFTAQQVVAL